MPVTLVNARLFTATGGPPVEDDALTIDGETISWIGRASELPEGTETIDCGGRTLMPGLIDVHAHLVYEYVRDPYTIELSKPVEEAAIDAALNAALLLRKGFTAIRDVGTRGNIGVIIRDAINADRLPGPRMKATKQIISVWGGLGDMHPTHIFRREQYAAALTEIVTGPWEARSAVRQQVKDGVDWIKAEASGTGFNPLCPAQRDTMSFEELQAVVDEATDKGLPVACHAESRRSIIKAAKAGVRTIEHAIYLDDEGIEAVLANGVAICPTMGLYTAFAERGLEFGIPQEIVSAHRITHERHLEAIRSAHSAGVTIVAGSDSGLANFPQGGGLEEICSYVEAIGMSNEDALLSATRDAAAVIGFEDTGTLEIGKRADLLLVNGDPLERIRVLTDDDAMETVVQGGAVVAGALPSRA
jgi:imidazolonepropionase-like amidohydrolase